MLEISTCSKCKDELWQYGEMVYEVYQAICIEHVKEPFDIPGIEHVPYLSNASRNIYKIIQFLETKGYVVSTESDISLIRIKPIGMDCIHHEQGVSCHICFHKADHNSVEENNYDL